MGIYRDHILPRGIDWALRRPECTELRARVTPSLSGTVLEVGFGSGLNLPHLPPAVDRLLAVDPATVGRKLARDRIERSPVPVEFVGLGAEGLDLPDASVDAVLSTWTLCSIRELDRALAEMRRVLRPRGTLHFLEHGRSPDSKVAKWQRRLNPIQRIFAGGCILDLDVEGSLGASGYEIEAVDRFAMKGPKVASFLYLGVARRP